MILRRRAFGGFAVAMVITATGCGSSRDRTSSSTSTSPTLAAPATDDGGFAPAMADPIDTWRTSFQSGPRTFAVPGTVLGTSVCGGPIDLVASGDALLGSQRLSA